MTTPAPRVPPAPSCARRGPAVLVGLLPRVSSLAPGSTDPGAPLSPTDLLALVGVLLVVFLLAWGAAGWVTIVRQSQHDLIGAEETGK